MLAQSSQATTFFEQRLGFFQAIRDPGVLPADAGFYLVAWQIDAMATQIAEVALRELDEELSAIEVAHGLDDDEFWMPGEGPEEYESLLRKYHAAWDGLFVEQLEQHGEHEMSQWFVAGSDAFQQRSEIHASHAFSAEGYEWVQDTFPQITMPAKPDFESAALSLRRKSLIASKKRTCLGSSGRTASCCRTPSRCPSIRWLAN